MAKRKTEVTFEGPEEMHAWVKFAAGASAGCQGEGEDTREDAGIAADFADDLLEQLRKRRPR